MGRRQAGYRNGKPYYIVVPDKRSSGPGPDVIAPGARGPGTGGGGSTPMPRPTPDPVYTGPKVIAPGARGGRIAPAPITITPEAERQINIMRAGGVKYLRQYPKAFNKNFDAKTLLTEQQLISNMRYTGYQYAMDQFSKTPVKTIPYNFVGPIRLGTTRGRNPLGTTTFIPYKESGFWGWVHDLPGIRQARRYVKDKGVEQSLISGWERIAPQPKDRAGFFNIPQKTREAAYWAAGKTFDLSEWTQKKQGDIWRSRGVDFSKGFLGAVTSIPSPITRGQAKEVAASAYIFSAFSPLIKTGTAQQAESQYADDVVEVMYKGKKVKMTLSQAKSLGLDPMSRTQATGAFQRLSKDRQIEILKKAFKGTGGEKRVYFDVDSLMKDVKLAEKFMREAGLTQSQIASRINILFPNLAKQSTVLASTSRGGLVAKTSAQKAAQSAAQASAQQSTFAVQTAQMPRIDVLLTAAQASQSYFQPSKTGQTQWLSAATLQMPKLSFYQGPELGYDPAIKTDQPQKGGRKGGGIFTPTLPPVAPTDPRLTYGGGIKPGVSVPKFPRLLLPGRSPLIPVGAKKGKSYIPQVRSGKKWKTVGKRMDRNSAMSRASRGADISTSRRFRVKPSKGKPQVTGIAGWGSRSFKFRPYKKVKGRRVRLTNEFIEKKQFAIDSPSEIKGLSIAKVSKNMGWITGGKKDKTFKRKSHWLF